MESIRELRTICQKGDNEAFVYFRVLVRPISIYITRVFLSLGISANSATLLSIISVLTGSILLVTQEPVLRLTAGLLLYLYTILDGVDGEVARYHVHRNQAPPGRVGQYADAIAHLLSFNIALFGLGMGLYLNTGMLTFVGAGFLASFMHSRVQHAAAHEVITTLLTRKEEFAALSNRVAASQVKQHSTFARLREWLIWPFPMGLVLPLVLITEWMLQTPTFFLSGAFLGVYLLFSTAMFVRSISKQMALFRSL